MQFNESQLNGKELDFFSFHICVSLIEATMKDLPINQRFFLSEEDKTIRKELFMKYLLPSVQALKNIKREDFDLQRKQPYLRAFSHYKNTKRRPFELQLMNYVNEDMRKIVNPYLELTADVQTKYEVKKERGFHIIGSFSNPFEG